MSDNLHPPPPDRLPGEGDINETVDERFIVMCSQTREGRAAGREPQCSATSIRWMNQVAATAPSTSAVPLSEHQHLSPDGGTPIPLPPEGNRDALVRGTVTTGPATQYWRPGGVYMWRTESLLEIIRHAHEMKLPLRDQHRAVQFQSRIQRYNASYERSLLLHSAGKAPHPGPRRNYPFLLAQPLSDSASLVEVTPKVLWDNGVKQLKSAWRPTEQVWSMVGTTAATQLWGAWAGSVSRGDPRKLWDLLGQVTEDYHRRVEEQRKQLEAEVQSRRSGEKAP